MIDLTTTYLGLKLSSPLVISASPLSRDVEGICRLEEAGASAVVLYSLFEEQLRQEEIDLDDHLANGTESFAESLTFFPQPSQFHTSLLRAAGSHLFPTELAKNDKHYRTPHPIASQWDVSFCTYI